MAVILITGAAGFIGHNLWEKLYPEHEVIGIDNMTDFSNQEIKYLRLSSLFNKRIDEGNHESIHSAKGKFHKIDIRDREGLSKLLESERIDILVHLAALTGIRPSLLHPDIYQQVNVEGFKNILELGHKHGVKRVVFASSSSVYGSCSDYPFTEDSDTSHLLNPYAETKKNNELFAESFASSADMNLIGLRFFTVYGPWTRPDMATFKFIKNTFENNPITIFRKNEITMTRDFTFVDDIVSAISKLLTTGTAEKFSIFNIGEGAPVLVSEYVDIIQNICMNHTAREFKEVDDGEMIRTYADCTKLFTHIGFKPNTHISEGLKRTVEWYRETFLK